MVARLMWMAPICWALVAGWLDPASADVLHASLDRLDRSYDVHWDLTYVETTDVDFTLFTARGIRERERSMKSFTPGAQSLDVVEAWVEQPDGSRIAVAPSGIFTRPSEDTQSAPGFSSAMTTTVLYPQLRTGSRTHIRWRLTQKTPPLLGFNVWAEPPLEFPVGAGQVTITAPADLRLAWRTRGFQVVDEVMGPIRVVRARISGTHGEETERDMVSTDDFQPLFLATTLPRMEEIGAIYWRQSHDKAQVTPEIATLAQKLGGATIEASARGVYNWVAQNIRYVAVYLDPDDGWVPHAAAEVLHAGYGDCKDHVVLMQALLAALGVRAEAAVIDWGDRTTDAPLWVPQFNHAIVYLPDLDRYVNPTNPYARFESLDRRLSGKTVVIATPEGRVARTPPSKPVDASYVWDATVTLAADGSVSGAARMRMSANLESLARSSAAQAVSASELAERLLVGTPQGGFGTFHTSDPRDLTRPFDVVATWHSPHAAQIESGETLLAVPVGPDIDPPQRLRHFLMPTPRQHAMIAGARDYRWTTLLRLPPDLVARQLPDDIALANAAGSYTASYVRVSLGVRVERHLVVAKDVYQPPEAAALDDLLYAPIDDARALVTLGRVQTEAQVH